MTASFWFVAWALTSGFLFVAVGVAVWLHTHNDKMLREVDETIEKMRKILEERDGDR